MQANTIQSPAFVSSDRDIGFPYKISFADCAPSDAVRFQVEHYLAKLSRIHQRIVDCKVIIRIPHKHGMSFSRVFHIHIALDLPGKRIAVSRDPEMKDQRGDVHSAISAAFHRVTRQLEDFIQARHS